MRKFETLESIAIPMPQANIDTDQIIPARFLARPREAGLAPFLFHDQRYAVGSAALDAGGDGTERCGFVLNEPLYRHASILVAGPNFGCGSSREHSVCALLDWGIRAVMSARVSDIFVNNALENGLLPITLAPSEAEGLLCQLQQQAGARVTIDLEQQSVRAPDGSFLTFAIDERRKRCLLLGLDSIRLTMLELPVIEAFEQRDAR